MAHEILPLQPAWIPALAEFLRQGFGASPDAPFAAPDVLHWKYLDPDGSGLAPRSLVARDQGRIIGHVGLSPTAFVVGRTGRQASTLHLIDWLAPAAHAPIGAMLMLQALRRTETQFAIGGTVEGSQVTQQIGYRLIAPVAIYHKILRPTARLLRSSEPRAWKSVLRTARDYARLLTHHSRAPLAPLHAQGIRAFDDSMDAVVRACAMDALYTTRTAERWNHHLRHPRGYISGWSLSQGGRLRGGALLSLLPDNRGHRAKIMDLFLDCLDEDLWQAAVHTLTSELRRQNADWIECYGTTPWMARALQRNGFFPQGSRPFWLRDPQQRVPAAPVFYLTHLEADHGAL